MDKEFKCNKTNKEINKSKFHYEKNLKDLCFGQMFKCPEKETNRKLEFEVKDI